MALDVDEVHGFESPGELARLRSWLAGLVADGQLEEAPVEVPYSGSTMFIERWYRTPDGEQWRLVEPESPFRGVFARVRSTNA